MANDYKPLNNAATNLEELLMVQNSDGVYASKYNGKEPFEVLAAKTIFNNYADVQAAIAADVEGPAFSTDNALARFDGTTGKLLQNSNAILTDAGALSLASNLTVSGGTLTGANTAYIALTNNNTYSAGAAGGGHTFVGTGNSSFGGNLTVSGTGTSSVAGNLNIGEPTGSGYRLYVKAGFGLALGGSYIECGEYDKPCSILNHTNPSVSANLFQIQKQGSGVFTVSSAGNLLIGTTTDGGQKLQVAGDLALSGVGAGFTINATSGNSLNIIQRSVNTAAGAIQFKTSSTADWIIGVRETSDSDFHLFSYGTVADVLTIARSTGNATFAGAIAINNTVQTAAAVASTHKVTISIGGSTYYLLATNV